MTVECPCGLLAKIEGDNLRCLCGRRDSVTVLVAMYDRLRHSVRLPSYATQEQVERRVSTRMDRTGAPHE